MNQPSEEAQAQVQLRATEIHEEHLGEVYRRSDRVFAYLMAAQWVLGVLLALAYSPYSWEGRSRSVHPHIFYAILLGGLMSGTVILLVRARPGWVVTRHTVVAAQMMWSALLIHLSGGRIETHFHVFGSLAFVAFYRDYKVLVTATLVVSADHFFRGYAWPESVYGISNPEWWRFLEHAGWVVFEDVVLVMGVLQSRKEMRALAVKQAETEAIQADIERQVATRTRELSESREQYRALVENTRSVPWQWACDEQRFVYVGPQGAALMDCAADDWLVSGFLAAHVHPEDQAAMAEQFTSGAHDAEFRLRRNDGQQIVVRSVMSDSVSGDMRFGFMLDITEQRRLEFELGQAQKLESVGRLASGIAHEINTPIQFVNDSVHFVREAFDDTAVLLEHYRLLRVATAGSLAPQALSAIEEAEEEADLPYILENVPKALERSVEGLARVATLVRSMKDFAHPDQRQKGPADLNRGIESTVTIALNEYKYVAELELALEPLPPVVCHVSELNQVILNLVVNASHAIADVVRGTDRKGLIRVTSRQDGAHVVVTVSDTGGGIPEAVRARIFEPFFTTKEVGKGTGQGLAIARSVVVDKHGGSLSAESVMGEGTVFTMRVPTEPPALRGSGGSTKDEFAGPVAAE